MTVQQIELAREPVSRIGLLTLEPGRRAVRAPDGEEQILQPRVMQVLLTLAHAEGETLSRADLRERCWGGRAVGDDATDRVIAQIRRLSETIGRGSFTIETIPKVGYRLVIASPSPITDHLEDQAESHRVAGSNLSRRHLLVVGGAAAAGAIGGALFFGRDAGSPRADALGALVLAVLPFSATGQTEELETFARQLSNEIRADLSRVGGLRVIAETSSNAAAKENRPARVIGERLGASLLVEGQVQSSAEGVQVQVALVETATETRTWADQARRPAGELQALRPIVSGAVLQQVLTLIPPSQLPVPIAVERPDPQAYIYVSEANRLLEDIRTARMRGREEDALALGDRASKLAKQALAIDPQESSAMLVLASLTRNGWTHELAALPLTTQQRVEASIRIVRRALLADPNNAAALTQLGDYYRRYEFRWTEAERLFRRALAINPSLIDAHWSYGYQLGTTGRALEGLDHALSVFELDSQNLFRRLALPRLLYIAGQRETAMRQYYVYLKQQPDNLFMLRELYLTFISEGNADALAALSDRVRRSPASGAAAADYRILSKRIEAGAEALRGRPGSLLAILNADVSEYESGATRNDATPQGRARDDLPYILSVEYAWAGEPDRSIDMLERALAAKSLYWPPTLPFGPAPYPLAVRSHARYLALWQRDPGLQALIRMRRNALLTGQMAGIDAQGKRFTPTLPPKTALRVRSALKQTLITG